MPASVVLAAALSTFVVTCPPTPEVRPGPGVQSVRSLDGRRVAAQGRKLFGERHGRWCHYGGSGNLLIEEHLRRGVLHGPRLVLGRTRTEHMYERGERHGPARTLHDGVVVSEGWLERGSREGHWVETDMLGPRAEGEYIDGRRSGPWRLDLRGGGRLEVEYRAGLYHGVARELDRDGRLVAELTYVDAEVLGPARLREPDGSYASGHLEGEHREGRWSFEGADGSSLGEGGYRRGERHGAWRSPSGDGWEEGVWSDGKRDGPATWTNAAGVVQRREGWKQDARHGPFEAFDAAGVRRSLQTWRDGVADGLWGSWDGSGVVAEGAYDQGRRDGPWVERATVESVVGLWTGRYRLGLRDGVWRFEAAGRIRAEQSWADGAQRLRRRWSADGVLVQECALASGRPDGLCVYRYEDGSLRLRGEHRAGLQHGTVSVWGADGVLLDEASWVDGERDGPSRQWHEDGTLRERAGYAAGAYHGEVTQWSEAGVLVLEGAYREGEPIGVHRAFHDDGRLASRCSFDDEGSLHGPCETWFTSGRRHERVVWEHDVQSGASALWWPSGVRRRAGEYVDGQREGRWRFWDRGGVVEKEGEYELGLKTGLWAFRDGAGRTLREVIYDDGVAISVRAPGGSWDEPSLLAGDPDPDPDPEERRPPADSWRRAGIGLLR